MEKRKPHCALIVVHRLVAAGKVRATGSALADAARLDVDFAGMISAVNALTIAHFYKSMTTHADHKIWQDVYQTRVGAESVYLKLTVVADVLIVSFKELNQ
jgi:motility quorum-sensing regulator / GCU-specific mRNA interferase toxin